MSEQNKLPIAIKLIIGFHLLNIFLWIIGQGGAVFFYDSVANLGLQDPRDYIDPVIVEVNKGIGLADMISIMPLFIIAVIGLWRLKFYGLVVSWMAFGFSIYWPVVYWASQYFYGEAKIKYVSTSTESIIIPAFFLIFALWASWYLYNNYKRFV